MSILEQQVDQNATHNFRTPALELGSVYGRGPAVHPFLYDRSNPFRLLLSPDGHDLARNCQEIALNESLTAQSGQKHGGAGAGAARRGGNLVERRRRRRTGTPLVLHPAQRS
ncbi:MAG TPA: hypothetical protein VHL31_19445 [Geminicoccus sp.]|uniref:hypothetical protein n=1 Tax=Geminicoccus sp. TaxID=2024832 RepID=UPI002E371295|nr:hypothetical protein [Geminicoccus sp.]HEX2528461.1 hypothetical protein [Geminicoccus sp.]